MAHDSEILSATSPLAAFQSSYTRRCHSDTFMTCSLLSSLGVCIQDTWYTIFKCTPLSHKNSTHSLSEDPAEKLNLRRNSKTLSVQVQEGLRLIAILAIQRVFFERPRNRPATCIVVLRGRLASAMCFFLDEYYKLYSKHLERNQLQTLGNCFMLM